MKKFYGDGTIFFDKSKSRWIVQICTNSKTISKKSFKLKSEAEQYLKNEKYKDNPKLQRKQKVLQDVMYENLELKLKTNQIGQEQYERVKRTIKMIEKDKIANMSIKEIDSNTIQAYYLTTIENSQSTINKIHEQFYQAFKYSIIRGYIENNPMNNVHRVVSIR